MTSDYQCPSNYVVRDIQRRGSPAVRGKRQGERGELRDSSEGSPTLHFPPIEEDTTAGSCHQKAASFSALHRNVQEEAKRTFHQWGGFLRSRIIPALAASGGRSEGYDPQVTPPSPSPLTHSPPPPYHPPDQTMTPTGGEGGQPRGKGSTWANREPAVEGKSLRTVEGSYLLSPSLLS